MYIDIVKGRDGLGFPRTDMAVLRNFTRDFPRVKPEGNPEEQPC